jgi:hypothetical protein
LPERTGATLAGVSRAGEADQQIVAKRH